MIIAQLLGTQYETYPVDFVAHVDNMMCMGQMNRENIASHCSNYEIRSGYYCDMGTSIITSWKLSFSSARSAVNTMCTHQPSPELLNPVPWGRLVVRRSLHLGKSREEIHVPRTDK